MIIKNKETKELLLEIKDECILSLRVEYGIVFMEINSEYDYIRYMDVNMKPRVAIMQDGEVDYVDIPLDKNMEVTF